MNIFGGVLIGLSSLVASWIFVELTEDLWEGLQAWRLKRRLMRDVRFRDGK